MAKPEWGTKQSCPKCNTRFYDLMVNDPAICIGCGHSWVPESILKSKQPLPFGVPNVEVSSESTAEEVDPVEEEEDLDIDDGDSVDNDVDIGGGDDLGDVVVSKDTTEDDTQ